MANRQHAQGSNALHEGRLDCRPNQHPDHSDRPRPRVSTSPTLPSARRAQDAVSEPSYSPNAGLSPHEGGGETLPPKGSRRGRTLRGVLFSAGTRTVARRTQGSPGRFLFSQKTEGSKTFTSTEEKIYLNKGCNLFGSVIQYNQAERKDKETTWS